MSGSTWGWNGGAGEATIAANWTLIAGPGSTLGYPQAGDTAIDAGGTVLTPLDTRFSNNILDFGGTAAVAELVTTGDTGITFADPTFSGTSMLSSAVPGNSTAETSELEADGNFVNQGTILADGPAGSSFTVAITSATIDGTFAPGYAYNPGLIEATAGNTLTISIGASSELFNAGSIVADGGTVLIEAAASAIAGGYAPIRGVAVIEDGGTLETNAAYASTVIGTVSYYVFGDTTAGNTLKIDNIGSFGGAISGFAAGDSIDLGTSLAVGTLVYSSATGFLYLENNAGTVIASLLMTGPFASGTYAVSDGTADGFTVGTGADGDTVLTTSQTDPIASGTSGTWQSTGSWLNGMVPGTTDTPRIGQGASSSFTLTTGSSPVAVAGFSITAPQATVQITSDTTATTYQVSDYAGTLDVEADNTLTAQALQLVQPSAAITIAAGATMDLTSAVQIQLAPIAGVWSTITADQLGARFSAGTAEIDGSLLAGPPTTAGGGGSVAIGWDSNSSASVTVGSGGTVTDTYTSLGSDPSSSGTLTLNGPGASWTDVIDPADPEDTRGNIEVGYNDTSQNTPAGLARPAPVAAAQLLVENGATLTDQSRGYVGYTPDSAGTVTVTSGGLWNVAYTTGGILEVGDIAQGALTVSNDGTVEVGGTGTYVSGGVKETAEGLDIGRVAGSSGTVTVESGGVLRDAGGINAGESGQGTLDVLNGGTVDMTTSTHGISIGVTAGGMGTIVVSGTASIITLGTATDGAGIGQAGQGLLEVENGGTVAVNSSGHGIGVGETSESSGTIEVTGTSSLLTLATATSGFGVGEAGQGLLEIENGGTVAFNSSGDHLETAETADGSGTILLSGTSSLLTLGTASAGIRVGEAGQGLLEVENGGTLADFGSGENFEVGDDAGSSGTAVVSGSGALLALGSATTAMEVGFAGAGVLDVENGGTVAMAAGAIELAAIASGTMTVSGVGSSITNQGSGAGVDVGIQAGFTAVASVQNGGSLFTSGSVNVGMDSSSATLTVAGTGSNLTAEGGILVGTNGTLATLDVQNEGTVSTTNISIGSSGFGKGTVAISGGGELEAAAGISIWGTSTLSVDATSSVDVGTSGSAVAGSILIESGQSLVGSGLISASVENNGSIESNTGTASLSLSYGTLEIAGSVSGTGSIVLTPNSTLRLDRSVSAEQSINFAAGGAGTLIVNATPSVIDNPITGLNVGDVIEFGGIAQITTAELTSPGTITVQTTAGTYVLNDVSFAAGVSPILNSSSNPATGYQEIQVLPASFGWAGTGTDLGAAASWNPSQIPDADDALTFNTSGGGTLTGVASGFNATYDAGGWVLQGATLSLAGQSFVNPTGPAGALYQGGWSLSDYGTITVNGGVLTGGVAQISGEFTFVGGTLVPQAGTIVAQNGAQVSFQRTYIGNGSPATLLVTGPGTTWRDSPGTIDGLTGQALFVGVVSSSPGSLTITNGANVIDLGSDTISQGVVTVSGGGSLQDDSLTVGENGAGTLAVADGTVNTTGGNIVVGGIGSGTLTVDNGGVVTGFELSLGGVSGGNTIGTGTVSIDAGGIITATSVSVASGSTISMAGGVLDPTVLTLSSGGRITGYGTLESNISNASTITAEGGTLQVTGSITGTGTLGMSSGGNLVLNGSVASGQKIDFLDSTGMLVLGDIAGFKASVAQFTAGDEIVVGTTRAATFSQSGSTVSVISSGTTLGVLTFASTALATSATTTPDALVDQSPRTLAWIGVSGTNFADAANWDDITDGLSPATAAPTAVDTVEFNTDSGAISGTNTVAAVEVGVNGTGVLELSGGATLATGSLDAAVLAADVGQIGVAGAGTELLVTGSATVADDGTGVLSILSGATFAGSSLTIGNQGDSSGAMVVSGDDSKVTLSGALNIGTALGTGDLTVGPGASVVASVVNLQGDVVLEGGFLDPTVYIENSGSTTSGFGTVGADYLVLEGTIISNGTKLNKETEVVLGTIVGGGTLAITGGTTADGTTVNSPGILQIGTHDTIELTGAVLNTASTTFTDTQTPTGTYTVTNSVIDVVFQDSTGVLLLDDIAGFGGTIATYRAGDSFVITGGALSGLGVNNGNTLTFSDTGSHAGAGGLDQIIFGSGISAAGFNIVNGNTVEAVVPCFAAGTRIGTPRGEVAVEALRVGDLVCTAEGAPRPIVWIGRRTLDCRRHPSPEKVWPVRIAAHAFGPDLPRRDLLLSPDHAVYARGVLIPVRQLINGTTIARHEVAEVSYFHVELDRHDVVLADGLPVESYLDTGDRARFANAGVPMLLHPDFSLLRWEVEGCAPLTVVGPEVEAVRRDLAERSRMRGSGGRRDNKGYKLLQRRP